MASTITQKPYYVELHNSKDGQFYYRVHSADNAEIIFTGETHPRKHDAQRAWTNFEARFAAFVLASIGHSDYTGLVVHTEVRDLTVPKFKGFKGGGDVAR